MLAKINSTGGINIILFRAETIIPMQQLLFFLMLHSLALEFKKVLTPIIGKGGHGSDAF